MKELVVLAVVSALLLAGVSAGPFLSHQHHDSTRLSDCPLPGPNAREMRADSVLIPEPACASLIFVGAVFVLRKKFRPQAEGAV